LGVVAVVLLAPSLSFVILGCLRNEIPLATQLGDLPRYLWDTFVHGDLGYNADFRKPMLAAMLDGLPVDIELLVGGVFLGVAGGLAAGLAGGQRRGGALDSALNFTSATAMSLPIYWFGYALLALFAPESGYLVQLPFLSRSHGYVPLTQHPLEWLRNMWVPWVILALPLGAMCYRMTRASLVEVLDADHIRVARAKGLRERVVMRRHALRAALPPVIGLVSASMALMVTNVILVETAFALPGFFHKADVGQFLGEQGHLPGQEVVQALILEAAVLISVSMLIADLFHARLDPRARALS
jgi:peptide/nickel transport system permease protein